MKSSPKLRILAFIITIILLLFHGDHLPESISEVLQPTEPEPPLPETELYVHFIDVGQGDCILIRSGSHNMLIDAGENSAKNAVADYLDKQRIHSFDSVIATHSHSDHIGSLDYAVSHFDVGTLYVSTQNFDAQPYQNLITAAEATDTPIEVLHAGDSFTFGEAQIRVLGPLESNYENVNDSSLVLMLIFGKNRFLLMGDAEADAEKALVENQTDLAADVLKVGHHGSDTSTGYTFLREVMPAYAVIQVGAGNSYGLPDEGTLSKLNDAGTTVYRNDVHGTVVITSDGTNLTFQTEKDIPPFVSTHADSADGGYIGNINSKKFHCPDCSGLPDPKNSIFFETREEAINAGYEPCGKCKP